MLQEDLGETTDPSPVCSVVEGGPPDNVLAINGDAGTEQEIEHVDIVDFLAVVGAYASNNTENQQCRVCVAHRLLPPREVRLMALGSQ